MKQKFALNVPIFIGALSGTIWMAGSMFWGVALFVLAALLQHTWYGEA